MIHSLALRLGTWRRTPARQPQPKGTSLRTARYVVLTVLLLSGAAIALQLTGTLERRADGMTRHTRVDAWAVQQTEYELQRFRSQLARYVAGDAAVTADHVEGQLAEAKAALALMQRDDYHRQFGAFVDIEGTVGTVDRALRRIELMVAERSGEPIALADLRTVEEILVDPATALRQLAIDVASVRQELQDGDLDNVRWLIDVNKWAFGAFFAAAGLFIFLLLVEVQNAVRAERNTRHLAEHDSLTDLPNRTVFFERIDAAVDAAQKANQSAAVLLIDLDRFKDINDTLGHATGDVILQMMGKRLIGALREFDTLARLGGDEFGVLLPAPTTVETARTIADRLLDALEDRFEFGALSLAVEASIGIALVTEAETSAAELIRQADVAMYVAKRSKMRHAVYDQEQDAHSVQHLTLTGELRQAIEEGQLELHYQPKVDLATNQISGVEALMRWMHPENGMISPAQFIPFAEQTNLIWPMTEWLFNEAAEQWVTWRREGIDLDVSVNLSTRNFQDEKLVEKLQRLIDEWHIPADRFVLEITETMLIADPERTKRTVDELRDIGFQVSIDDFGTGYSSLAYLKDLHVNELKIDMAFVRDMQTDERNKRIVESTVALAHALDLKIVAEGVEDMAIANELAAMGCDTGQGYYYSRPLPGDDLARWLDAAPLTTKRPIAKLVVAA